MVKRGGEGGGCFLTECGFKEKWSHVFSVKLLGPQIASSILLLRVITEFVRERKGRRVTRGDAAAMHACMHVSPRERNQKGRQINEIERKNQLGERGKEREREEEEKKEFI